MGQANMNAIVLIAIGDKYEKLLNSVLPMFESYAKKCGAALEVCRKFPDPSMSGHLFTQKLLLPKQYQWLAFLDLDILISKYAPSIFDYIQSDKGLGAIIEARDEDYFLLANKRWFKQAPEQIPSPEQIFSQRGFPPTVTPLKTFNGGVILCQPALVGNLFADYYWEITKNPTGFLMSEELPMGYMTQTNDLFFELDPKFNQQMIYLLADKKTVIPFYLTRLQQKINKRLNRFFKCQEPFIFNQYAKVVEKALKNNYIVHFSGNFPIPPNLKNAL